MEGLNNTSYYKYISLIKQSEFCVAAFSHCIFLTFGALQRANKWEQSQVCVHVHNEQAAQFKSKDVYDFQLTCQPVQTG